MKFVISTLIAIGMLAALPMVAKAQIDAQADSSVEAQIDLFNATEDAELEAPALKDIMSQLGANTKTLVDALVKNLPVPDAKVQSAANAMPGLAAQAAQLLPKKLLDQAGKPKPGTEALVTKYRQLMSQLHAALVELQQNVSSGNRAAAKNTLVGKVAPIQREGHELFKD